TINNSENIEYSLMNYSNSILNNIDYSIDFNNNDFNFNSSNWSADFITLNDVSFDYEGIILNTSFMKTFQLDFSNVSMLLSAINNSNLIMIDFEDVKNSFDLKLNIKVNEDADNYYNFNSIQGYYLTSKNINSKSLAKGYNFIAKTDSGNYFAVIFNANDLKQSSDAIIVHNNYLKISLSKYSKKIYLYATNDYSDLLKIVDGLNNNIIINNELLTYNYFYTSQTFKSSGTIFG
ncbi:MAG: hypothetical protein PHN56_01925, partial [Candidatus Nanoarchaeia archaeon]|nr:hypothetical protein [Candidatus Nanoarchaeia archaeon]